MGQEVSDLDQLARACAAIANGGLLVKPKLILKQGGQPAGRSPAHSAASDRHHDAPDDESVGSGTAKAARIAGYTSGARLERRRFDVKAHRYAVQRFVLGSRR
jgi:cell division protein FtsI/penicillin-binding protein 2